MGEEITREPSALLTFNSPSIQMQASNLYDGHELRTLTSHLGQQALTPRWSPRVRGEARSHLFDSCEINAVVLQLNGALRATRNGTVIYSGSKSKSCLQLTQKKSVKKQKITGSGTVGKDGGDGGLVLNLWKKVKGAILGPRT